MIDANKVESWLPVLTHPDHGAAICDAAGCHCDRADGEYSISWSTGEYSDGLLYPHEALALAFSAQAAMQANVGCAVVQEDLRWLCLTGKDTSLYSPCVTRHSDPESAILAAAYRWLGIEVPL